MTSDLSVAEYLDEWLVRREAHLRPSTSKSYRQTVRCYLAPFLGDEPLDELDRRTIETTYARLFSGGGRGGRPLSPKTVKYCHAVLRRALEDAVLDGLLDINPAHRARTPSLLAGATEVAEAQTVWDGDEVAAFLRFVEDHPWRNLWHVAVGTGARRGELLGLRWEDVDTEERQLRIRRALTVVDGVARLLTTKTSRSRVLSIGASVLGAFERERGAQAERNRSLTPPVNSWELVFTGPDGGHLDPMDVTREFRALVRRAPVPTIRLHDLRHTHATLLLDAGVPIKTVSERLGHSTIVMTMDVYAHVLPAMDRDAAERLEAVLDVR